MMLLLFPLKKSDYRIHFWYMNKDDAINIMKNFNLKKWDIMIFLIIYKNS